MTGAIVVGFVDATVSGHAGDWAVARAAATGGAVELLAIVGGAVGAVGEQQVLDAALAHATDAVAAEAARLGAGGVAVSTRVDHGNPVAALVEASAHAALVVIGGESRGQPITGQNFFGSTLQLVQILCNDSITGHRMTGNQL
ncbi:universal stress protein [uncultured Microbacterium sp.]|uniref:universal stress protein n=1 Tax=uncultured Microbacterium sp. TaxID=191216 RepID=UPI00258C50DC|nr:universal stress protein [uncultured Microbacterium sp.]